MGINDTGLTLSSVKVFNDDDGGDIFHVKFDFCVLDKTDDFYESADLTVILKGKDLKGQSVTDIEKSALERLVSLTQRLSEHVAASQG